MKLSKMLFFATLFLTLASCNKEYLPSSEYGIFSSKDSNTAIINGVIDTDTPEDWEDFIADFPNTTLLIMQDCPGSNDDDANLRAAQKIRQQGVTIHLPADAEIASGAVDLFLAGTIRTREAGSKIGVHAWTNGDQEATDFPEGDIEHQSYIDYYVNIGFSLTEAEAFYYFTINAATADDIHWMTDAEIVEYGLLNP